MDPIDRLAVVAANLCEMSRQGESAGLRQRTPSVQSAKRIQEEQGVFGIMDNQDFDQLLCSYRQSVDAWVGAIRAEESLATEDHSMVQMEKWDDAVFQLHDTELTAKKARDAYKNALRKKNYGF